MTVTCCKPRWARYPSGSHRTHSSRCPEFPNVKVGDERPRPKITRVGPTEPHPICAAAHSFDSTPCSRCAVLLHESDCACDACSYGLAHMDDEAL